MHCTGSKSARTINTKEKRKTFVSTAEDSQGVGEMYLRFIRAARTGEDDASYADVT